MWTDYIQHKDCTHFRHPTDEQLQHSYIFSNYYNLQSVHFNLHCSTGKENYHLITFFGLMFYFLEFHFLASFHSSSILGSLDIKYVEKLNSFLAPVLQSSSRSRFVRCWRAQRDGWAASTFHSNCDGKGPTVTIIQVGSYIFGGYTDQSWSSKYHFISELVSFGLFLY